MNKPTIDTLWRHTIAAYADAEMLLHGDESYRRVEHMLENVLCQIQALDPDVAERNLRGDGE